MIVDSTLISCLSWRALPPSIESSNSLSEISPPPISCHASSFSESVPSVSQSRFAIKRGKSLDFRLGRSHHSRNSPVID
uniref:Putative ovule protein n=1 Tax=Solanum chacoense TaxID=4108 RepID=A0A0V0HDS5_SOLCH